MTTAHNAAVGALLLDAANLVNSGAQLDPVTAVHAAAAELGANFEVEADALAVARDRDHWRAVCEEASERSRETIGLVGEELRR